MEELGINEIPNRTLNDLPDEILLHILSLLPTLDAVQTSLISHKWRHLWSRVPSLNFDYQLFPPSEPLEYTSQFYAEFVDRVLIFRANSPVHTFRLSFIYHSYYGSHVESWVRSAVTRLRARELYLDLFVHDDFHDVETVNHWYDFPFSVLRNGCVEKLGLTRCYLTLPAKLSTRRVWSIRSLFLDQVYLADQMVKDLILGCPNLEELELQKCSGHRHLKICSKRLKRLTLGMFFESSKQRETLLVDCPNLRSISFNCCSFFRLELKNASSLVEFRVDFVHMIHLSYSYWIKVVGLLEQVPNLKHLHVQNWLFMFLTSKDSFPESFMLHNLKILELRTGFTQYDLVGIAALLKLCLNLETMILGYPRKFDPDESLPEELLDKPVEFSIPSLKKVTIKPYTGTEDEGKFVKILTEQGVVLEKIVLVHGQVENRVVVLKLVPPVVLYKKGSQTWNYSLLRNSN
ncbi:hypothetical protein ACFX1Q_024874 [Malus domestica]